MMMKTDFQDQYQKEKYQRNQEICCSVSYCLQNHLHQLNHPHHRHHHHRYSHDYFVRFHHHFLLLLHLDYLHLFKNEIKINLKIVEDIYNRKGKERNLKKRRLIVKLL